MMTGRITLNRRRLIRYSTTALILALGVIWFFTLRSQTLGGPVDYVIVSGHSMEPTYNAGDLILMRRSSEYHEGDIIQYTVPDDEPAAGTRVIHRIVGEDTDGFITRGDNNDGNDLWRPQTSDIAGKEWLRIPNAGKFLTRLRAPIILASLAALLTVYTVLTSGKKPPAPANTNANHLWRERLRRRHRPVGRPEFGAALLSSQSAPVQEEAMSTSITAPDRQQPPSPRLPTAESARRWSFSFPSDPRASYALAALVAVLVACLALTSFQSGKDPSIK